MEIYNNLLLYSKDCLKKTLLYDNNTTIEELIYLKNCLEECINEKIVQIVIEFNKE